MPLPVVFQTADDLDEVVDRLRVAYAETKGAPPDVKQIGAWKGSIREIKKTGFDYPVIAEYSIFDLERADFLVVGRDKVLTVEAKGWNRIQRINDYSVEADGGQWQDPCYQLNNYVSKLRYFHSASSRFSFDGVLLTYNASGYSDSCNVVRTASELASVASNLGPPATKAEVDEIINGRFVITKGLIDLIKENQSDLLEKAANVLLKRGYGLSAEQSEVVRQVKHSLENKERKVYLVKGESGSGKTLVALTLLFEAISRNHKALLGYRNNRLLHTLKTVLKVKRGKVSLASLIQFYSMGAMRGFKGIGEPNFPMETFSPPDDPLELVIFDEAQRMTDSVIQTSMTRAPVSVYFYDESQILIGDEQGTRENLERYAKDATEVTLSSPFRAPKSYLDFVDRILEGNGGPIEKYDFRTYADVGDLLKDLGAKEREKFRVALVAAFTESDGNRKDASSSKNVRLGYPLQSGFDLYRGLRTEVRWLMDERVQYPRYWMGLLDPLKYCASVYGAQGFEADYVGMIWGRDLVRRSGVWEVDPRVVTDRIGGRNSLKTIAQRDPSQAMLLLKNRYYVLLTRGIRGIFIFFEDAETRDFVKGSIRKEEVLAQ